MNSADELGERAGADERRFVPTVGAYLGRSRTSLTRGAMICQSKFSVA